MAFLKKPLHFVHIFLEISLPVTPGPSCCMQICCLFLCLASFTTCHLQHLLYLFRLCPRPSPICLCASSAATRISAHAIGCYLPQTLMNVLAVPENSKMEYKTLRVNTLGSGARLKMIISCFLLLLASLTRATLYFFLMFCHIEIAAMKEPIIHGRWGASVT